MPTHPDRPPRPRGRPRHEKQKADELLVVRLTADGRKSLRTAARKAGVTVADYVRAAVRHAIDEGVVMEVTSRDVAVVSVENEE